VEPALPPHTVPLGEQPDGTPPPEVGEPQRPVMLPACFAQLPVQHSELFEQMSFCCVQNETALEQIPLLQSFEQQSPCAAHGLPAVRHEPPVFRLAHLPASQMPLQQSPSCPHAPAVGLSGTHCLLEHEPFTHEPVQHSFGATHAVAGALHSSIAGSQSFVVGLQLAEQQSPLPAQVWATSLHVAASLTDASLGARPSGGPLSVVFPLDPEDDAEDVVEPEEEEDDDEDGPSRSPPSGGGARMSLSVSLPHPTKARAADESETTSTNATGSFLMRSSEWRNRYPPGRVLGD